MEKGDGWRIDGLATLLPDEYLHEMSCGDSVSLVLPAGREWQRRC